MPGITSHASARRVAVTGIGLVSPLGCTPRNAWEALRTGATRPVLHEHRLDGEVWGSFPLFRLEGFDPRSLPLPDEARAVDLLRDYVRIYPHNSGRAIRFLAALDEAEVA